jgi:hypothetical protein
MKKPIIISTVIILLLASGVYFYLRPSSQKSYEEVKKFALPAPEDIVLDKETGLQVVKDVMMITFSKGTEQAAIDNIIKDLNGRIIGYDRDSNLFQVKIPGADFKDIQSKRQLLLGKYRQVEMATPETVSVAKDPYWKRGATREVELPSMEGLKVPAHE